MNRLEQLERLAAGVDNTQRDALQLYCDTLHHQRVRAKEERPLSPGRAAKLERREQRQAAKQARKAAKWEVMAPPAVQRAPLPEAERCPAMTLAGHRCTLRTGHTEGHMGRLPSSATVNPALGITLWCRWQRHADDFD